MNERRAEVQRKMLVNQIAEVNRLITQIGDALDVAEICEKRIVVIGTTTAARALRNLEDLNKRYLMGRIQEE